MYIAYLVKLHSAIKNRLSDVKAQERHIDEHRLVRLQVKLLQRAHCRSVKIALNGHGLPLFRMILLLVYHTSRGLCGKLAETKKPPRFASIKEDTLAVRGGDYATGEKLYLYLS